MPEMRSIRHYRRFRDRLWVGEPVYGTMIQEIGTTNIVKILARTGLDFYIVDCEHGPFGFETVSNLLSATDTEQLSPIVRIPEVRKESIQKFLDAGAAGILVPWVRSADEVREAVRLARYAPEGCRGFATFKPWSDYTIGPAETMLPEANRAVIVVAQVETSEAVDRIDGILSVPGLDALLVGPGDLSLAYGVPGKADDRVTAAIERVLAAARAHGTPCGIHCMGIDDIVTWRAKGMRLLSWNVPLYVLFEAYRDGVRTLKGV